VAGKQSVDDLRNDAVFVTLHAGKKRFTSLDGTEEVGAEFVFHRAGCGPGVEIGDAA
jgi:hypothetical protein